MRIVIVDLHTNTFFVNNAGNYIRRQKAVNKHKFLLDWLLDHDVKVVDFVTINGTTLPGKIVRKITKNKKLRKLEANLILRKNGYSNGVEVITDSDLIGDDDIVLYYSHFYNSQWGEKIKRGIKIVDLLHFYGDRRMAEILKKYEWDYYFFEVELKDCPIFMKNYSWFDAEYLRRDFSFQPRFKMNIEFSRRKKKAMAIGTITECDDDDFKEIYGTIAYQPKRKNVYEHVGELEGLVDSFISPYEESSIKIMNKQSLLKRKIGKIYYYFNSGKQKNYFSFNIVEKFNEYQMFLCPEDAIGSYGVSTFEGMACGCVCLSDQEKTMKNLGFVKGVDYIYYDGTISGLRDVIVKYQRPEYQEVLKNIALSGMKKVTENYSQELVAQRYYDTLRNIAESRK